MQRLYDFISAHYASLCIIGGGCMGFIVAMLRNYQSKKSFTASLAEAATCACLSSALAQLGVYIWNMNPNLSIFVGTFCGFLGTDFLKRVATSYIDNKVNK